MSPSSEFIALCQAQVYLLVQGLGAAWCAVYLTEAQGEGMSPNLLPVVVYPEASLVRDSEDLQVLGEDWVFPPLPQSKPLLNGKPEEPIASVASQDNAAKEVWEERQLMLPLIYEGEVMGLLVTRRDDRGWEEKELAQVEQIVSTLAIARFLDRQQGWDKAQLLQQQRSLASQRDRFDDLLHQLRNPLTALRTFGKLLLKRLLPGDRNREIAENLLRESDRLQGLLKQLDRYLDEMSPKTTVVSQSSSPKLLPGETIASPLSLLPEATLKLQPLDIGEVLRPLLRSAEAIAGDREIEFEAKISEDLLPIQGDANALREVLNNLLDNGIKYTPSGGRVTVEAGLEHENGLLQGVAIRDTGYGIPDEDKTRIFDRHYRGVQAEGDIEGSGLGLAIVKELVEQMHGSIEVSSHWQGGTSFVVWLPLA